MHSRCGKARKCRGNTLLAPVVPVNVLCTVQPSNPNSSLCAAASGGQGSYDSDPLDEELRNDGIEMIAPHRSNRSKPPTQDRRRLSRYMRRWLVERFFAWKQWQRRILVRWEYHAQNFLGFVQLACLVVLFRRF